MDLMELAQKLADAADDYNGEDDLRGESTPIMGAPIGAVFMVDFTDAEVIDTRGCSEYDEEKDVPVKRFRVVITEQEL